MMKNILLLTLLYSLASVSVATDNFVECYEDCGTPKDNCEVEKTKENQQNTYVIKDK